MLRLVLAVVLFASSARAVELSYQWKKGDVHRFRYEDETQFAMSMGMGMPAMNQKMSVRSTFSEKILAVRPDGTADAEVTVEKLEVVQEGRTIATEAQLPKAARTVKAELDRKGHAKFFRMVTVYMKDDQVFLGVESNGTGGKATASAGGETVELVAAIDPKTGTVTASATVKKEAPKLKAVEVKEEDPSVDVLPKDILAMMELPEGQMQPGSSMTMKTMLGDVTAALSPLEKDVGRLNMKMDGNKVSAGEKGVSAKKKDGTKAAMMPSMPGMPDMSGMMGGMPGMDGMAGGDDDGAGGMMGGGGAPTTNMQMDFDVTGTFDVAKGKLLGLDGTAHQDMGMGGMGGMKVDQKFKLVRE